MEKLLMRTFPTEQLQMPKHQIALKKLDHGEIQSPSISLVKDPEIKI